LRHFEHTHTISHTHSQKAKDDDIETGHEKEAPGAAPWRWESDHPLRQLAANICESNPQDLQEHVFGHHHLLDPCWGAKHSVQRYTVGVDVERINVRLHTFFCVQDRASVKRTCKIELCLSLSEVWSFMTVAIPELIDVGLAFEAKRIGASASVVWPTGLIMPYTKSRLSRASFRRRCLTALDRMKLAQSRSIRNCHLTVDGSTQRCLSRDTYIGLRLSMPLFFPSSCQD